MTIRIAMWSGPRNISTAMMRAFENRADTAVVDEPFYAAYLAATGIDHPMRAAVIASQPTDPDAVIAGLTGAAPGGAAIFYQKHMTQHMLPGIDLAWTARCRNVFLIRDPEAVVASYLARRGTATAEDLGFRRQRALFDREAERLGCAPPVIDADDVLDDPEGVLQTLCRVLSIPFDPAMLSWPAGRRASDGVWAPAWYAAVEASTGFAAPRRRAPVLEPGLAAIAEEAWADYHYMATFRLTPALRGDPF